MLDYETDGLVFPKPKRLRQLRGICDVARFSAATFPKDIVSAKAQVERLGEHLGVKLKKSNGGDCLVLGADDGEELVLKHEKRGSYALRIREAGVKIAARDDEGLANGVNTVCQIFTGAGKKLPCVEIFDAPDLAVRGYHLDCKGGFPDLDYLYQFIERLAQWKINMVWIEYEDWFPFKCVKEIVKPGAPSLEEWKQILAFCRLRGIMPVPLIQTHGHLEFLLKHEKYRHLAEGTAINEICPSNPDAVEIVRQMIEEVLELHQPEPYFHVGADETWCLATCPECVKRLEAGEAKLDIYSKHLMKWHELLKANGKRLMMWCDMFWRTDSPEKVESLPRDIILCEWIYHDCVCEDGREGRRFMYWGEGENFGLYYPESGVKSLNEVVDPDKAVFVREDRIIERAGEKLKNYAAKYFRPDADGVGNLSPHYIYFQESGFDLIGVGAARCGTSGRTFGQNNISGRLENAIAWANFVRKQDGMGVVISSWSRSNSLRGLYAPWETALDGLSAHAQYAWNGQLRQAEYIEHAAAHRFGVGCGKLLAGVYNYLGENNDIALQWIKKLEAQAEKSREYVALLKGWVEFDIFRHWFEVECWQLEAMLFRRGFGLMPDVGGRRNDTVGSNLELFEEREQQLREDARKKLRETVTPYFRTEDTEEYLACRFSEIDFRYDNLLRKLKEMRAE